MGDYTPTTEDVLECWSEAYQVGDREGAFNRWIADYESAVRADQIEKDAGIVLGYDSFYAIQRQRAMIAKRIRAQLKGG
jgi:hypothetical protein